MIDSPHDVDALTASEWRRNVPFVRQHSAVLSDPYDPVITVRVPSETRALADATWFRPVLERLVSLASLPQGWDGSAAPPIDRSRLEAVLDLLAAITRHDTPPPAIVPGVDGGVQVDWHVNDVDIEISLPADGQGTFFAEDLRTEESWEDVSLDERASLRAVVDRLLPAQSRA